MSIGPTGLECITAYEIKSDELEALVRVTDMRAYDLTKYIRLAAASRARARAAQHLEFQKRFGAVVPGNS